MFVPGSNLLGTLEGVVVARNVRHDCTLIRFGGVDQICFTFERRMFRIYTSLQKYSIIRRTYMANDEHCFLRRLIPSPKQKK